ncbi:MAG: hypothetical protein ACXWNZ_19295, partial [Vulcanimicrobiaceae bacterium]
LILAIHLLVTFAKLARPGGLRAVAAESLLLKHHLLISNRSRQRAPNLSSIDRFVLGLTTLFVSPRRIFLIASPQTRSQRSCRGTHRRYRRDETAQSQVRLCANRPADHSRFWHRDR